MRGKILDYTIQSNTGVITGDDGSRYAFSGAEWKASASPKIGMYVDFVAKGSDALGIYLVSGSTGSGSSRRMTASLLALFVGGLGAHKFYLGMTKPAVIMLCVWLFGWVLIGIPTLIISIIAFVEFIIYVTKSDEDFEQLYVIEKKEWF